VKKPSAVVGILLVVSQSFVPGRVQACIRVSLWDRIAEADLIVVARVESIELDPTPGDPTYEDPSLERRRVTLKILETWKGPAATEVQADFSFGVPDRYAVGDIVIQFFERGETRSQRLREATIEIETYMAELVREAEDSGGETAVDWTPEDQAEAWESLERFTQWSAGRWLPIEFWPALRHAGDETRQAMKALVEKAVRLHADGFTEEDRAEWAVTAVERYATRRYGLYELDSDRLKPEQLRRLAAAFVREPAVDETDLSFLKLFERHPSFDVDRAAAAVVEAGFLIEPIPWWVTAMVDESLKRYGNSFADRIGRDDRDSRGRLIYTGKGQDTLPTIWEVARRELGIPQVLPAEVPLRPGEAAGE
jgi:hypothetical protein